MTNDLAEFYAQLTTVSERACSLAEQFWERRGSQVDHEHMRDIREFRTAGHLDIVQLINRFRGLQPGLDPKEELQLRLGLWLCSFFFGFPLPLLWERVRHLDPVMEGIPGTGAVYDKLAGDVYRAERKFRDRLKREPHQTAGAPFDDTKPVLALAFSPTALLPDEDWNPDGEQHTGVARELFLWHLRHLAGRYLRLQMWLYFTADYPLRYVFVIEAAAEALVNHPGDVNPMRMRETVEERFEKMGGDKAKLVGLHAKSNWKELDTWTSCTFGVEYGVLSDSPQVYLSNRHFTWTTNDFLKAGRAKMERLLEKPALAGEKILIGDEAIDEMVRQAQILASS